LAIVASEPKPVLVLLAELEALTERKAA